MNWQLDSILEQSIAQMAEGKARVESCLLAYPAQAAELRPLLLAAEAVLAVPKPAMAPEARARIEAQLFEAAVANGLLRRERKPLKLPRLRLPIALPRWRLAYSVLAAIVVVALLMTTTMVGAANALPGSPFYPVKLATEDVWLWVAPARDEPALHLRFAQRRLEEYRQLAVRGEYDDTLLDAMVTEVNAALDGIEQLPPAVALPLLVEAERVVAGQREVLAGMLADVPADMPAVSQAKINLILGDTATLIARVDAMRWTLLRYETGASPEPGLTVISTGTLEPGASPTATFTPTVTLTVTSISEESAESEHTEAAPTETSVAPTATSVVPTTETPPSVTPVVSVEPTPTKKTPPGLTKTAEPPGLMTRTPNP